MTISRRNFLGLVTGSAATLLSFRLTGPDRRIPRLEHELACAILDLHSQCVLRESLQGYQAALRDEHNHLQGPKSNVLYHSRIVIVPGLGRLDPAVARTLVGLLHMGTHVLLESGAAFLSVREFAAHQKMLDHYFDVAVFPPVDLWSENSIGEALLARHPKQYSREKLASRESVPYVDYVWPHATSVRDFSRVIPVSGNVGDVIGRVGTIPVALKRHVAQGTLIFLGSPLGPALRACDREARSWVRSVAVL